MALGKVEQIKSLECVSGDVSEPDRGTLRRVCDDISLDIFLVAVAELAERFTYRSITAPMQNYIQNGRDDPLHHGALGMGQKVATGISYFFVGWCYLAPIFGAIVADSYLGRFKTIFLGTGLSMCGVLILFITSLPTSLDHGGGLPGLMLALILIGLGCGGIKSNVGPLIAEQYSMRSQRIKTLDSGERVIVDPNVTVQTIYARYYWITNVGALSIIPASWLELKVDFWAAFMLPFALWLLAVLALVYGRRKYVVQQPHGCAITKAARILWISMKNNGNMDAAKSFAMEERGASISWDDTFVDELKRALVACRVFPIFWLCNGQANNNLVSQASSLKTYGMPHDMMGLFNPVTILIAIPLFECVINPALRRYGIPFRPISRMTTGFVAKACAIAIAAGIQQLIYMSPPSHVSIFLQVPVFSLIGLSEFFSTLSGMEYAYTKAPKSMRSIVSSLFLLTCTIGSTLGITLSPVSVDPKVLVEYVSLSIAMFATALLFYCCFGKYNKMEESMNKIGDSEKGYSSESTEEEIRDSDRLEKQ
ncbi:putative POT peptide transporter [Aspergillus clavatus NRRL 1]|uniref:Oligopeptide transporter n=1 Tax=Aspergillus clavatus (strain ATCC 1007 / CBS 513.65 / DSM 816 / NCTC 3887 / NRRL 1 / QM 1276 / 107) TaxID=344612 RepID=A1CSE3_ASPCL|nr:oligopeptide transporter [Aspergillus clavatus NRRL 1]EAW08564.1 oligopeptide transporter [Aspergillus clavatus NRRL 1]